MSKKEPHVETHNGDKIVVNSPDIDANTKRAAVEIVEKVDCDDADLCFNNTKRARYEKSLIRGMLTGFLDDREIQIDKEQIDEITDSAASDYEATRDLSMATSLGMAMHKTGFPTNVTRDFEKNVISRLAMAVLVPESHDDMIPVKDEALEFEEYGGEYDDGFDIQIDEDDDDDIDITDDFDEDDDD